MRVRKNCFVFEIIVENKYFSGKAGEMVERGDNTYGGKYVVNPSGGLISKGHPLGATGKLFKLKRIVLIELVNAI